MSPWFINSTKRNLQYEHQHVIKIEWFGPYYAYETNFKTIELHRSFDELNKM